MNLIIKFVLKTLLYSLVLNIFFIHCNEIILLPFNSSNKPNTIYKFSFLEDLYQRNLYTMIKIGDPEYKIEAILSVQNEYFALIPNKTIDKDNNINIYYNYTKSNTFKNITRLNQYYFESKYDIVAQEKFKIKTIIYQNNNINNEIILNNFNVILGVNDKYKYNKYFLNIGLKMINNQNNQNYNFIYQLKQNRIINNYYWCLFFERGENQNGIFLYNPEQLFNANGKLIIGDLPSKYESNKYYKSQLLITYSYDKDLINSWGLEFNSIYHVNKKNKTVKDMYCSVYLDINNHLVQAPKSYYYQIKNEFFKEYLSKKICNIYTGNGFESIYCDKSQNFTIKNLQDFPILYLQNNELQFTFKFNYEDLFVEKDEKFWFLVTFPTYYEIEEWYFGIIFLRKYILIFNPDSKTISFYNPNLPLEEDDNYHKSNNNNNNNNKIIKIIIIILLVFIFVALGFFIGKFFYNNKKSKKRINELDDSFEYICDEEQTKNNNVEVN